VEFQVLYSPIGLACCVIVKNA